MEKKNKLPGEQTQAFTLLQITAISGEFPATLLDRLPGGESYRKKAVFKLKKDGLLHTYYKDGLRTYRLGFRAKRLLLMEWPERFSFYLEGNTDTNLLKSEITRRIRLCRIASAFVTMMNAGVEVLRDCKPKVFLPDGKIIPVQPEIPAFYSSREIKEIGQEAAKIRGARLTGVLLTENHVLITYNQDTSGSKWDYRAEMNAKALIWRSFCHCGNERGYPSEAICGLLLGDGLEPLFQILSSADSGKRCLFLLDGNYEHFYYQTNDHYGETLLKLFCNQEKTDELNAILMQDLYEKRQGWTIENDAVDEDGNPVLFGYFLDMPRLVRFVNALKRSKPRGTIICFDYQSEVLSRCFGEYVELQTINFEKFEERFCG